MIELLIKMLEITDSNHPNIQILKGRYKIMTNFRDAKRQFKMQRNGRNI